MRVTKFFPDIVEAEPIPNFAKADKDLFEMLTSHTVRYGGIVISILLEANIH